jgi:hypothetical protein
VLGKRLVLQVYAIEVWREDFFQANKLFTAKATSPEDFVSFHLQGVNPKAFNHAVALAAQIQNDSRMIIIENVARIQISNIKRNELYQFLPVDIRGNGMFWNPRRNVAVAANFQSNCASRLCFLAIQSQSVERTAHVGHDNSFNSTLEGTSSMSETTKLHFKIHLFSRRMCSFVPFSEFPKQKLWTMPKYWAITMFNVLSICW